MPQRKPFIGIPMDVENSGGYAKVPWYALRKNYCEAIAVQGGVPVLLPHELGLMNHYSQVLDGLLLTGGDFDIPPNLYGAQTVHERVSTKPERTDFEWGMAKLLYDKRKPILGICGGMQLLNVLLGGNLIQHIEDEISNCLTHHPLPNEGHAIKIYADSRLYEWVKQEETHVNSSHHQAVKKLAPTLRVSAVARDGIIEAIEDTQHPFCIGVQWHPEYFTSSIDEPIFQKFIEAAMT